MTNSRSDLQQYMMLSGLAMAIVCLPFSVKLCHIGLLLVILSWGIQWRWREKWNSIRSNIVVIFFVVFFILNVAGLLYTKDPSNSWFNIEKKIVWIVLPIILASTPRIEKKNIELLFTLFIAACFIGSMICVVNAVLLQLSSSLPADTISSPLYQLLNPGVSSTWMLFSYIGLASGIDIHPTYFSLYLLFCLLLLFKFCEKDFAGFSPVRKAAIVFLAVYFCLFIICLSSRITTLALLILAFVQAYSHFQNKSFLKRAALSLLTFLFFCFIIFVNPVSRYRNFQEPLYISYPSQNSRESLSISIRASLWWLGVKSTDDVNLVWGAGPGDVKHIIKDTGTKYSVSNTIGSSDPHNQFLQTILALGFIGLISLLSCFFIPAYLAFRNKDFFYVTFLCLFVFVGLTETVLEMQKGIVFFSIFNSLLIFQYADWSITQKNKLNYA